MKKVLYIMLTGALLISLGSCVQNELLNPDEKGQNGPVSLTATIVNESDTKATLNDGTGAFAFSGTDAIKVYNGDGVYEGTTSTPGTTATFTMEDGFTNTGSGFAGFPASLVSNITASGVTFTLPASYEYTEVGSSDPDAAKVPCPMMGTFIAGSNIQLKQAGAVVRFRVTNITAGSLTFTFPTFVSGKVTVSTTPSGTDDGILVANFSKNTIDPKVPTGSKSITVHGVPSVPNTNYSYIYITLPVPTSTVPDNILVTNDPVNPATTDVRMAAINKSSSPSALNRAVGYKMSVTLAEIPVASFTINGSGDKVVLAPGNLMAKIGSYTAGEHTATASEWKFGGYFEIVGQSETEGNYLFNNENEACVGKWVDLYSWQGANATIKAHGLLTGFTRKKISGNYYPAESTTSTVDEAKTLNKKYFGFTVGENLYDGCWNTGAGGITISNGGTYNWRPMTSQEWKYILTERGGADDYRYSRATVAGVNGLLIFPDGTTAWNDTWGPDPATDPGDKNGRRGTAHSGDYVYDFGAYTAAQMFAMANAGVVFLPCTGYSSYHLVTQSQLWGYYWTATGGSRYSGGHGDKVTADYLNFNVAQAVSWDAYYREVGRAVRLARDLN